MDNEQKYCFKSLLIVGLLTTITSCTNYKANYKGMNKNLVERLDIQIKSGNYAQIYEESSSYAKNYQYSKDEVVERLQTIAQKMKAVDESFSLKEVKSGGCGDEGVYRDDNYACGTIEKNGKKLDVAIWMDNATGDLKFTDLCIYLEDSNETSNFCATDASKE